MFHPIFMSIVGGILLLGTMRDPGDTFRRITLATLLFAPAWMTYQVKSIQLDHRTGAYLATLALVATLFGHIPLRKWLWTDTFCLAIWVGQVVSQALIDELRPLTAFELARLWILPYLAGRTFFLRGWSDISKIVPYAALLILAAASYDAAEALTKMNPVNKALGKSFSLLEAGEGYRWGMKRAQGPMLHPIYNGMMLTMMLPWALSVAKRGLAERKKFWMAAPLVLSVALFFTVSRGPQLAFMIASGIAFFFRFPKLRVLTLTVAIVGGGAVVTLKDPIMNALKSAAGETEDHVRILVINGEEVEYSGTNHRMLLFMVYEQALQESGWFGYGQGLRNVPMADGDVERFGSIDNHYIKHYLEYGWWGLVSFLGLGFGGIYYAARTAWNAREESAIFAAGLAGCIFSTMIIMLSVWFSFDYGSMWLLTVGISANLYSLRQPKRPQFNVPSQHKQPVATPTPKPSQPEPVTTAATLETTPSDNPPPTPHLRPPVRKPPQRGPARRIRPAFYDRDTSEN